MLDEADRMLDQGFERDIRQIVGETHKGRQTALFSATWPDSVRELAHSFLNRPIKVTIGSEDLAAGNCLRVATCSRANGDASAGADRGVV